MANDKKYLEYAVQLTSAVGDMFNEDSEFYIDQKELEEDDNLTHFIHALASVMPAHFFNSITGEDKNHLEFNHTANQLCFQYGTRED